MRNKVADGFAAALGTWFGCGFFPIAPGTVGSLGALLPAWFLATQLGWPGWYFAVVAGLFYFPGVWSGGWIAWWLKRPDPSRVVIDEVVGQWLTLAGAARLNWKSFLAAFILFRLFDIFKPPPVRQLEDLPGGWGIMTDDVMAGLYGALVLFGLGWFNLY